ncbi:MAG TPA: 3D domain-containing protein [Calditerricola sp.]
MFMVRVIRLLLVATPCMALVLGTVAFGAPAPGLNGNDVEEAGLTQDERFQTSDGVVVHVVQPGETVFRLSRWYGVTVEAIVAANRLASAELIRVGQSLIIPKPGDAVAHLSVQREKGERHTVRTASLAASAAPGSGWGKVYNMTLTAYTAGPESTGKWPGHPAYGITASGERAVEGVTIAVDPRVIPLGSLVYIEGLGYRVAQDTGGAIKGNRIDVFFNDVREAIAFGVKRNVRVYVIE